MWLRTIAQVVSRRRHVQSIVAFCCAFFILSGVAIVTAQWSNSLVLTLNSFTLVQGGFLLASKVSAELLEHRLLAAANGSTKPVILCSEKSHCEDHDHSHNGHDGHGHHHHSHHHHHRHQEFHEVSTPLAHSTWDQTTVLDATFPYGLQRVEVLVQFAAFIVMMFAAGKTLVECAQRALQSHDTSPVLVEVVSLLHCALVCLTCKFTERETLALLRRRHISSSSSFFTGTARLVGFYAGRCVSPITCIVSCQLVLATGIHRLDIVFASGLACWIALESYSRICFLGGILLNQSPLAAPAAPAMTTRSGHQLMQARSSESANYSNLFSVSSSVVYKAMREMQLVPGVLAVDVFRVWTVAPGFDVVSTRVRISREADEQDVLRSLRSLLESVSAFATVQCERSTGSSSSSSGGGKKNVLMHDVSCSMQDPTNGFSPPPPAAWTLPEAPSLAPFYMASPRPESGISSFPAPPPAAALAFAT